MLGGAVRVFAETPGRPNPAEAFDLVYGFRQELTIARHDFAATANLAVRRGGLRAVGGFAGLAVSEDMDWGRRARLAGFPTRFAAGGGGARIRRAARWTTCAASGTGTSATTGACSRRPSAAGRPGRCRAAAVAATAGSLEIPRILASDRLQGPRQRLAAFAGARGHAPLPGAADARRARGTDGAPAQRRLEPSAPTGSARGTCRPRAQAAGQPVGRPSRASSSATSAA